MIDIETRKSPVYEGDGTSTGPFSFDFKVWDSAQVIVVTAATSKIQDVATVKILEYATDYTVTLGEETGGEINLVEPLGEGCPLVILSGIPYLQPFTMERLGTFNPEDLVKAWDRNCALIQQLCERLSRAIIMPPTVDMHPYDFIVKLIQAALDAKKHADESEDSANAAAEYLEKCKEIWDYIYAYSWDIPHIAHSVQEIRDYPYDGYFWLTGMAPSESTANITNRFVTVRGEEKTVGEWFESLYGELDDITNLAVTVNGTTDTLGNFLTQMSDALAGIKKFLESIDIPRIAACIEDVEADEHDGYFWVPNYLDEDVDFLTIYLGERGYLETYPEINRETAASTTEVFALYLLLRGSYEAFPVIDTAFVDESADVMYTYLSVRGN